MTYENKQLRRVVRHTVRFRPADDALLTVLADRLAMQKATLIESVTMRGIERELAELGLAMSGPSAPAALSTAAHG